MPIYRLLEKSGHSPEDIKVLVAAYELALDQLALRDTTDPFTETVARLIIEVAQTGEKDPARICDTALQSLTR